MSSVLSPGLSADERLAVRRLWRDFYVAATGAAITGVALTPVMGATSLVFWLGAWRTLQTVYEEVARICHAHGHDDLVPPEQRHR